MEQFQDGITPQHSYQLLLLPCPWLFFHKVWQQIPHGSVKCEMQEYYARSLLAYLTLNLGISSIPGETFSLRHKHLHWLPSVHVLGPCGDTGCIGSQLSPAHSLQSGNMSAMYETGVCDYFFSYILTASILKKR